MDKQQDKQYTLKELELIMEYENRLLGKNSALSKLLNERKYDEKVADKKARFILKFVFEHFFHWTPSEAAQYFDKEVIDKMQLNDVVNKIIFPSEMDRDKDFYFYSWSVYPQSESATFRERTMKAYKERLSGVREKLPKEFFGDAKGDLRAIICLNQILAEEKGYSDIKEYYEFMASSAGNSFLSKVKLKDVCRNIFGNPVNYLHQSLSKEQQNEFYYQYYTYQYQERLAMSQKEIKALFI